MERKACRYHSGHRGQDLLVLTAVPHHTELHNRTKHLLTCSYQTEFHQTSTAKTVCRIQYQQKFCHDQRAVERSFVDDAEYLQNTTGGGPRWIPEFVTQQTGPVSYKVIGRDTDSPHMTRGSVESMSCYWNTISGGNWLFDRHNWHCTGETRTFDRRHTEPALPLKTFTHTHSHWWGWKKEKELLWCEKMYRQRL